MGPRLPCGREEFGLAHQSNETGPDTVAPSGATRPALVGALFLLLSLLLAGCAQPAGQPSGQPPGQPSGQPSAQQAPAPASYQELLSQTDQELVEALTAVRRAPTLDVLDHAVLSAAGVTSSAGERLAGSQLVPPPAAADNTALAAGLRQLGRELAYLSQQINAQVICAAPAAAAAISTAPSMPGLREVAARLGIGTTDRRPFRWGAALPPPTDVVETRLPNGTLVTDRRVPGELGEGILEVHNEGSEDAVVLLARGGAGLISLAVSAGQSSRLSGVPDGDYELYYTAGRDWDTGLATFIRDCEFHRFTGPTSFRSGPAPGGLAHTVQAVTIQDVAEGSTGGGEGLVDVPPTALPR